MVAVRGNLSYAPQKKARDGSIPLYNQASIFTTLVGNQGCNSGQNYLNFFGPKKNRVCIQTFYEKYVCIVSGYKAHASLMIHTRHAMSMY